jgi:acetyltransferase-like isoleucine patch superfamily enzyme
MSPPDRRRSPTERARNFVRYLPHRVGYGAGPKLMSALRKRWVLLRHPNATITFGRHTYLGPGFSLHIPGPGTFEVGDRVEFRRNFRAEISRGGRITIASDARFTYDVIIQCSTSIEIGARAIFGQASMLVDGTHRFRDLDTPMLEQGYEFSPLRIGEDATVTSKCTVVADIGERAFIGANSVVARPVPPYCLAAGSPARPIEYYGPPGMEPEELRPVEADEPPRDASTN